MGWISRIGALFERGKRSAEHEEELSYHLAMLEDRKARAGLPAEEARLAARRQFGNATLLKEAMRDADVATYLESFARDIRFCGPHAG